MHSVEKYQNNAVTLLKQLISIKSFSFQEDETADTIQEWLKKNNISENEMLKTFNCGVGFIVIAKKSNFIKIKKYFKNGYMPYVIGKIVKGNSKILLNGKINW